MQTIEKRIDSYHQRYFGFSETIEMVVKGLGFFISFKAAGLHDIFYTTVGAINIVMVSSL